MHFEWMEISKFEYSSIRIISGIRVVLTGFKYYFRIQIFEYSTIALSTNIVDYDADAAADDDDDGD